MLLLYAAALLVAAEDPAMLSERTLFDKAVTEILRAEGGYVDHPADPGGETNFGISKRSYPDLNIKDLTKADACEIYYRDYWLKVQAPRLPPAIALMVFDHAVNAGPRSAVQILQRMVGATADGKIGPLTLRATAATYARHGDKLLRWYARDRLMYYASLQNWRTFGRSWADRVQGTTIMAAKWAVVMALLESEN